MMSQSLPPPAPVMHSSLPPQFSLDSIPELTLPPPSPGAVLRPEMHVRMAGVSSAPAESFIHRARRAAGGLYGDADAGAAAGRLDTVAESTTILGFLQSSSLEESEASARAAAADDGSAAERTGGGASGDGGGGANSEWKRHPVGSGKAAPPAVDDPLGFDDELGLVGGGVMEGEFVEAGGFAAARVDSGGGMGIGVQVRGETLPPTEGGAAPRRDAGLATDLEDSSEMLFEADP